MSWHGSDIPRHTSLLCYVRTKITKVSVKITPQNARSGRVWYRSVPFLSTNRAKMPNNSATCGRPPSRLVLGMASVGKRLPGRCRISQGDTLAWLCQTWPPRTRDEPPPPCCQPLRKRWPLSSKVIWSQPAPYLSNHCQKKRTRTASCRRPYASTEITV